ncbi:MAG TPA: hypothetical protein VJM31_06130, partial [Vicinamibacterales bacterium]|nr:hypothetical protein [Vicinamibacterales bacterium]
MISARTACAVFLVMCGSLAGVQGQTGQGEPRAQDAPPDFRLLVLGHFDADTLATFKKRAEDYAALRRRLEIGLPPLVVTDNADDIERFELRLAERIRHTRRSHRYQVFVPAMERQIKRLLRAQADPDTVALIVDDSPAEFDVDVN